MSIFKRISFYTTLLLVCLVPFGVWAVVRLPIGSSGVHDWLPDGRVERQQYMAFLDAFGNDQFLLISWDGCTEKDDRLVEFRKRLQLISCLSMAPFLLAGFLPTQQFAKLMIAMLTGAIVGDLLVLPALLMRPFGVVIRSSMAAKAEGKT